VAGLALYGLVTVLHDTLHGSFLPGKRSNRWLGELLAPLFLLDYASFRHSHLGHHRHNQSTAHDPKYPRIPRPRIGAENGESPAHGLAGPLSRFPASMAAWFRAARYLPRLPPRLRHVVYVGFTVLSGAYTVLAYGGELSLPARNWRMARPWLSMARSVVGYGALFWLSPVLGALALASMWIAMSCVFLVFLTHLSPYQLYMKEDNEQPLLFALNISDIRGGWLLRTLGNGFADHHAAHHVFPFVPCYRLAPASRWLEQRFHSLKAPVLQIGSSVDITSVFDGLTTSTIRPRGVGWFLWALPSGQFVRRTAVAR
jgi:fatty acid desaturase